MTKEEAKAAEEYAVFQAFAAAARLSVVAGSVRSRRPPEPDIVCDLSGGERVAFELVGLEDRDLTHATARAKADLNVSRGVGFDDPTLEEIRKKLTDKRYQTPHPMELVAHGGDTLLPHDVWLPKYEQELRRLFDRTESRFRRLWVVNLGPLAASDPVWLVHPLR
jgi:hypothetical protein